ncbi:MAG: histone deacetylase family protein [Acidimicrobiales bacterium]
MTVLVGSHGDFLLHDTGPRHPERAARLRAVSAGIAGSGILEDVVEFEPRPASTEEIGLVHDQGYVSALAGLCAKGGGYLDADTVVSRSSMAAASRAAGAGLDAVERLRRGEGQAAFLAVRPPGHHAEQARAMGFCLFNNVAITAALLAGQGERVVVIDWDAHHGNGTQDAFYKRSDVLYVSIHQYPFYPGTGALDEIGAGPGAGATVNIPVPAGTSGDTYRLALDTVVVPVVEAFGPSWVVLSAGFDAHRDDPLTDLGLSAGDFADLTARSVALCPPGRRIAFLEGGYDLAALEHSIAAAVAALGGEVMRPEPVTTSSSVSAEASGVVAAARRLHLGQ